MTDKQKHNLPGAHLSIHKVCDNRFGVFTIDGRYLGTLTREEVTPLLIKPEARREFLDSNKKEPKETQ